MNIIEMAREAEEYAEQNAVFINKTYLYDGVGPEYHDLLYKKFAELVAAHEREFIAEKWEKWYGYDKHGVAEFIRKRANTQGEQT
jgi:hypothetical protein